MAKERKPYVVISPLRLDGDDIAPGEIVGLFDKDAAPILGIAVREPTADEMSGGNASGGKKK